MNFFLLEHSVLPKFLQSTFVLIFGLANILAVIIKELLQLKTSFIRKICTYKKNRGMSLFTDLRDWYGGFPYEFCSSDILREFFEIDGFTLERCREGQGIGYHELVFRNKSQ